MTNLPALRPLPKRYDWRFESLCMNSNDAHFGYNARRPVLKKYHPETGLVYYTSNPFFRPEALIAYRIWRLTYYMGVYARMLP